MNIIYWLILGIVIGAMSHLLDPAPYKGKIGGSITLAAVGAVMGGVVGNIFFGWLGGFSFPAFSIATLGCLAILMFKQGLLKA